MALVSSNVSLEHYGGSRSQKNDNNVRRMLSMANVEKSCKNPKKVLILEGLIDKQCYKLLLLLLLLLRKLKHKKKNMSAP